MEEFEPTSDFESPKWKIVLTFEPTRSTCLSVSRKKLPSRGSEPTPQQTLRSDICLIVYDTETKRTTKQYLPLIGRKNLSPISYFELLKWNYLTIHDTKGASITKSDRLPTTKT